jgi:predicted permease
MGKIEQLSKNPWFVAAVIILATWTLAWKGLALWRAAKNDNRNWFVALLVVNTLGVLEILYLFVFGKKNLKNIQQNKFWRGA